MNKRKIIISSIVLLFDQVLKEFISGISGRIDVIKDFFYIEFLENDGAAFSILKGRTWLLVLISLIVLILIYNLIYSFNKSKLNDIAFGLLFGGIMGNLIDRVLYGIVRDFIGIIILGYNYPVFNIADVAIVVGIFLLLISYIRSERNESNSK